MMEVQVISCSSNSHRDNTYSLPHITFEFQPSFCPWTVSRRQFPLRPAYATTFNSCQGLTLDRAVIDLRYPVFAHGQLYTALSRVRHRDNIRYFRDPLETTTANDDESPLFTKNIVYQDLLLPNLEPPL